MKLIIDIDEEVKQTFDNAQNEDLYGNYYDRNSLIGKAIQNGIPLDDVLDKIRAEMLEEMLSHSGTGEEVIQAYADGLKKGLEFIDKYREGEQE